MFGFLTNNDSEKEIALPFKVVLEGREDTYFLAKVPSLPGCSARGRSKAEALKNIQEAVRLHLEAAAPAAFDVVREDASDPVLNCALSYFDRLVIGSSKDACVVTESGDFGAWGQGLVSGAGRAAKGGFKLRRDPLDGDPEAEAQGLVDFSPQVYALAAFSGTGVPKFYAGSSQAGSIYQSVDGLNWELDFASGEARVHALAEFKGRLYAGTSSAGKVFCHANSHWALVHRSAETAVTALCAFKDELFFGTYPGGQIFASADGVNWHLAHDSGQTFVRVLCEFEGALYAATSKASGGMVLRSLDGLRWEKVFESRDPNFYCLQAFGGSLWLGTGNQGRLYRSVDGSQWQLAHALEDEGIRAMASHQGRLYLATEGRGRVYRSRFADTPPPLLSQIRISDISSHSVTLSWRTDRPCDSLALFGSGEALDGSVRSSTLEVEHRLGLGHLKGSTRYRLKLVSRSPDGSEAGFSEELVFSTGGAELAVPKSPSHPDPAQWYGLNEAQLSWTAPEGIQRFHCSVDRLADTVPEPGLPGVRSGTQRQALFEGLDDGLWWFHLRCEDAVGNLADAAAHYALRVDTQALPPRLASSTHPLPGVWSNKAKAVFQWEAPEDLSGVAGYYLLLDQQPDSLPTRENGLWSADSLFSADLPVDGEWWLHAVTLDRAGNVGTRASHYSLKLDRHADPPSVESASHPDPQRWFNTSQLQLAWTPPADLSGIQGYYTLLDQRTDTVPTAHSGHFTLAQAATYMGKGDGLWYFHIVSVDAAGNIGTVAAHTCLRVDTWAPPPLVASPTHPAGSWVSSKRAVFELSPAEDLSGIVGYYYCIDQERLTVPSISKGSASAERSLEFEGLADGLWTLHVVGKDAAGNVGVEASHCTVRIDSQALPPLLSSSTHASQDDWHRQRSVEMLWDAPADLSGVACYFWALDQQPGTVPGPHSGQRCTEQRVRVEIPEDGQWFFHCATQDKAGNLGAEAAHYSLKIDTQALAPRLSCPTHPDKAAWSNHLHPRFEWFEPEDSSGIAGYYWSVDRSPDGLPRPATAAYTTQRFAVLDRGLEGDGQWWFHVLSRDRAGNVGTEASHWPLNIDTQASPPVLRSPSHPDRHGWHNLTHAIFEWDAPQDASGIVGYYHLLDRSQATVPSAANGTWTEENQASFAGLEDGLWTLHVVSKDACGNVGTVAGHYSVRIDTQALPPTVSSATHPEGAWTRNSAPTFTWTPPQDSSGIAGYYYHLDREPGTVPTKETAQFGAGHMASFPRVDDGVWVFHIVSLDNAGNVGTRAAHYSIHIDTSASAPKLSSSSHPDPDKWTRSAQPLMHWQAPADPSGISGYYWCVDQQSDTVPGAQSQWTDATHASPGILPDGQWWFHVATKDGAGNLSVEAAHFRLRIDSFAPAPKLYSRTHPMPDQWGCADKPSFVWEAGDDLSGIAGYYWVFDANPHAPVVPGQAEWTTSTGVTLPAQKDGVWVFAVAAQDLAGNVSEPSRLTVKIETGAPVSRLEALAEVSGQASVELRWRGEDAVSGVAHYDLQVRHGEAGDWKPWLSETTTQSATYLGEDGDHLSFRVRATDKAGNQEAFPTKGPFPTVLIDLSPPLALASLEAKAQVAGTVLLSWPAAEDNGSGVSHYEVWRYSGPQDPGQKLSPEAGVRETRFLDSSKDLKDGALYTYAVLPVDRAGNRQTQGNPRSSCVCDSSAEAPVLSSPTHPSPLDWSGATTAKLSWAPPQDSSGIAGYYWVLDQNLGSVPDPKRAAFVEANSLELSGLKDGTWYLHVATKDAAGNISAEAGHYQFNIDTLPPPAPAVRCLSHPNPEAWSDDRNAQFSWTTPVDVAQVAGYYWLLDKQPATVPGPGQGQLTPLNSASALGIDDGIWYFHVAAFDRAGNHGKEAGHVRLQVAHTPPPPKVSSPSHPQPSHAYGSRSAVFHWAAPVFKEPVVAWHYCLDQHAETVPDARNTRSTELKAEFSDLADGDWTFHIVSEGQSGTLGRLAEHFPVRIRSTGSLQGLVTKPNGILPLDAAGLELFRQGKSLSKQSTGRDGRYRFDELEPGDYLLKVDVAGQPPLLVDGLRLEAGAQTLNLSSEVCAWADLKSGLAFKFLVLAKETGTVQLRLFSESGQSLAQLEATAPRSGYVKLAWDAAKADPGSYLWQATHSAADGKVTKYPIRKLQVAKA